MGTEFWILNQFVSTFWRPAPLYPEFQYYYWTGWWYFFVVLYMTGLFLFLRIFFCVPIFWIIGWLPLGRSFFQLWCRPIIVIFWYGIKFSLIPLSTKYFIISSHFLLVQFSIFVSSLLEILYNILLLSSLFYLCNFYSFLKDFFNIIIRFHELIFDIWLMNDNWIIKS